MDVCVVLLCVSSMGFLVSQDVVSFVLCFELVNVPLMGLVMLRPGFMGVGNGASVKGWSGAMGLLVG